MTKSIKDEARFLNLCDRRQETLRKEEIANLRAELDKLFSEFFVSTETPKLSVTALGGCFYITVSLVASSPRSFAARKIDEAVCTENT